MAFTVFHGGKNRQIANSMLRTLGGDEGYRQRIYLAPDGTKTTLRTKDGMPSVEVETKEPPQNEPMSEPMYMETGQLTYSGTALSDPTRGEPAMWRMPDIDPAGKWLGSVSLSGKQRANQPTPYDTHILRDGIDSIAIGFEHNGRILGYEKIKGTYFDATIYKKTVVTRYKPSYFSGKMRQFVQAQYGAREDKEYFPFEIELGPLGDMLCFKDKNGDRVYLGWSAERTTGLFTTESRRYYLLNVETSEDTTTIYGYPLVLSDNGKRLRKQLLINKSLSKEEIEKIEAYIFASANVSVKSKFTVGSFASGSCGNGNDRTLAFGWKFNRSGSRISIVKIGTTGSIAENYDGRSKEIHISLSRSADYSTEDGQWVLTPTVGVERRWLDGSGSWNIFAPAATFDPRLKLYSMRVDGNTVPAYSFSNVPVYGYYNRDDVWVTASLSRTVGEADQYYEQDQSGLTLLDAYQQPDDWRETGSYLGDFTYEGRAKLFSSGGGATYEKRHVTDPGDSFDLRINGWSCHGTRIFKSATKWSWSAGSSSQGEKYLWTYPIGDQGGPVIPDLPKLNDYTAWTDYVDNVKGEDSLSSWFETYAFDQWTEVTPTYTEITRTVETSIIDNYTRWVLIIPHGDCEVIHAATQYININTVSAKYSSTWTVETGYEVTMKQRATKGGFDIFTVGPFVMRARYLSLIPYGGSVVVNEELPPPPPLPKPDVYAWGLSINSERGRPSGSYSSLFEIDSNNPYFNGYIGFDGSAGGRYIGTEGYNSGTVENDAPFVGWY